MSTHNTQKIAQLLQKEKAIENELLIKKNKNLARSLRRLLSTKRELAALSEAKSLYDLE